MKEPIAQGQADANVRARFWMTGESKMRLANGGNSKGAVPVHGKPSATAKIPLYDQAALDAAVAAERKACAKLADAHFIFGHSVAGQHFAAALADKIRKRSNG